jgi:hypothetical protein
MLATLLDSKLARNYLAFLTHNIFDCWRVFRVPLAPIQLREGTKLTAPPQCLFRCISGAVYQPFSNSCWHTHGERSQVNRLSGSDERTETDFLFEILGNGWRFLEPIYRTGDFLSTGELLQLPVMSDE